MKHAFSVWSFRKTSDEHLHRRLTNDMDFAFRLNPGTKGHSPVQAGPVSTKAHRDSWVSFADGSSLHTHSLLEPVLRVVSPGPEKELRHS